MQRESRPCWPALSKKSLTLPPLPPCKDFSGNLDDHARDPSRRDQRLQRVMGWTPLDGIDVPELGVEQHSKEASVGKVIIGRRRPVLTERRSSAKVLPLTQASAVTTFFCFIESTILTVPHMEPLMADDLDAAKQGPKPFLLSTPAVLPPTCSKMKSAWRRSGRNRSLSGLSAHVRLRRPS